MPNEDITISGFAGINNVADPIRARPFEEEGTDRTLSWLSEDTSNVDLDDSRFARMRVGTTQRLVTTPLWQYATADQRHLYFVAGTDILEMQETGGTHSSSAVYSGLSDPTAIMSWADVGGYIFFCNGTDSGIIANGTTRSLGNQTPTQPGVFPTGGILASGIYQVAVTIMDAHGRESGAWTGAEITFTEENNGITVSALPTVGTGETSRVYMTAPDGQEFYLAVETTQPVITLSHTVQDMAQKLLTMGMIGPPTDAEQVAVFQSQLVLLAPFEERAYTAVYFSEPGLYHLFDAGKVRIIEGAPRDAVATGRGLLVATSRKVAAIGADGGYQELLDFGTPPGQPIVEDPETDTVFLWTDRGVYSFSGQGMRPLTKGIFNAAHGAQVFTSLVDQNGYQKFCASILEGGTAYNPYA